VEAALTEALAEACARRQEPGQAVLSDAEAVARACHDMAQRFHRGGRLLVFGNGGPSTDAQHVSVEFVHPVVVGKRALPAMSLTSDVGTLTGVANREGFEEVFAYQLSIIAAEPDMAVGVSSDGRCANVLRGLETGRELGLLTLALVGGDGGPIAASPAVDHVLRARSDDPLVIKELHVTLYHILWELVHVFFEQPGVLEAEEVS
jgi:D-sedoheptulose 7-phosphate isomerase